MALIKCSECNREISDKAATCPGCGAPVTVIATRPESQQPPAPSKVHYNAGTDTFTGTMVLMVKLGMRAVQELGWKLDQANETLGLVTFQTGMSFGSFSGVSCSLNIEEVAANTYRVSGAGKQNNYSNVITLNLFGEAEGKARKAIEKMQELVAWGAEQRVESSDEFTPTAPASGSTPSNAESKPDAAVMAHHGITFDGERYFYAGYRYDKYSDALAYAQLQER